MGVINRSEDPSAQRIALNFSLGPTSISSGETGPLAYVPTPGVLQAANLSVGYMAGSSFALLLQCQRFIAGSGVTFINIGSTFVPWVFGTSGVIAGGISLPVGGFNLMANDVIGYLSSGGSTLEINNVCGCFVMQPTQDLRVYLGTT